MRGILYVPENKSTHWSMTSHDAIMVCMPGQSRDLTDAQWALLNSLIPEPKRRKNGRGRP